MSVATLILGEPGTGKTSSLRHLNPADTLLIQTIQKPLPFKNKDWKRFNKEEKTGNIFVSDQAQHILTLMRATRRKIIVLDDWNLLMTNSFFRRSTETGFQKFSDIGRDAWEVLSAASQLAPDVRVYLLGHTECDEYGRIKAKTIGKLIAEKCPVESLFSIVFRAVVINGIYLFSTKNNGQDTTKTPMGLFDSDMIPNNIAETDQAICQYYEVGHATA